MTILSGFDKTPRHSNVDSGDGSGAGGIFTLPAGSGYRSNSAATNHTINQAMSQALAAISQSLRVFGEGSGSALPLAQAAAVSLHWASVPTSAPAAALAAGLLQGRMQPQQLVDQGGQWIQVDAVPEPMSYYNPDAYDESGGGGGGGDSGGDDGAGGGGDSAVFYDEPAGGGAPEPALEPAPEPAPAPAPEPPPAPAPGPEPAPAPVVAAPVPAPVPVAAPADAALPPPVAQIPTSPLGEGRTPPRKRSAAEWDAIAATWNARDSSPYRFYQQMDEHGWTVADMAYISGQSEQQVGDYLTRIGAPAGFGGAATVGRAALEQAYRDALAIAPPHSVTVSVVVDESGHTETVTTPVFDLSAATAWFLSQDTPAAQAFARIHGAFTDTTGTLQFASGASMSPGGSSVDESGNVTVTAPVFAAGTDARIDAYQGYAKGNVLEQITLREQVDTPANREVMQLFGTPESAALVLPENEKGERMRALYGTELATFLLKLTAAQQAMRGQYMAAVQLAASRSPQWTDVSASEAVFWNGVPYGMDELNNIFYSYQFDAAAFHNWYVAQDAPECRLMGEIYGKQAVNGAVAVVTTEMGTILYTGSRGDYVITGTPNDLGSGLHISLSPNGRRGVHVADNTLSDQNLLGIDLRDAIELQDYGQVVYMPTQGFVTSGQNIKLDDPDWLDQILPIAVVAFVSVVSYNTLGPWAAGVAGFTSAGAVAVVSATVAGGMTAFASGVINDNLTLKDVLRGALAGGLTAGLLNEISAIPGFAPGTVGAIATRGTVQGFVQALLGGEFEDGALAGAAGGLAEFISVNMGKDIPGLVKNGTMTVKQGKAAQYFIRLFSTSVRIVASGSDTPGYELASAFVSSTLDVIAPPAAAPQPAGLAPQPVAALPQPVAGGGVSEGGEGGGDSASGGGTDSVGEGGGEIGGEGTTPETPTDGPTDGPDEGGPDGGDAPAPTPAPTPEPAPEPAPVPPPPIRPAFDDEGNLMPGIVDSSAPPAVQQQQLVNHLIGQGFSIQDAESLTAQWATTGNVAGGVPPNSPPGTGTGAGTPPPSGATPPILLAFDDEGNLMPGIVDASLPPEQQVQQLQDLLVSQGFTQEEAQLLASDAVSRAADSPTPVAAYERPPATPQEMQDRLSEIDKRLAEDLAAQQARDDSLDTPDALPTGGANAPVRRPTIAVNGGVERALNLAEDSFGLLEPLLGLKGDLQTLQSAQAENKLESMRANLRDAGVKNVPDGFVQGIGGPDGRMTRDYGATADRLTQLYETHLQDQRMRGTWGNDYQALRLGKSQMTTAQFEQKVMTLQQDAVDRAYQQGRELIATGQLKIQGGDYARTLGNYVDDRVRRDFREFATLEGLPDSSASNIWAINRQIRGDVGVGIPDGRLGLNLYHDTTLANKTGNTPQLRKWNAIQEGNVLIVRPTERGGSYVVPQASIKPYMPRTGRGL